MTNLNNTQNKEIIDIDTLKSDLLKAISTLGQPDDLVDGDKIPCSILKGVDVDGGDMLSFDAYIDTPTLDYLDGYIDFSFIVHRTYLSVFLIIGQQCTDAEGAIKYLDETQPEASFKWGFPDEPYDGDSLYLGCFIDYSNYANLVENLQKAFDEFTSPEFEAWLKGALKFYKN